jgi:hypothetical protein
MEVIDLVAQHGGTLGLAIFAIWMLNRTWELRLEEVQRYAADLQDMNCEMRQVIERNTEAWMRMMERVNE